MMIFKRNLNNSLSINKMIFGIDLSSYQSKIDIEKVIRGHELYGPCNFAIIKTTEGNNYENKLFLEQALKFTNQDIPIGTYHFAEVTKSAEYDDIKNDALTEATKAIKNRNKIEYQIGRKIELPLFLDLERNNPLTIPEIKIWREWSNIFSDIIKSNDIRFGVYGSFYFLEALNFSEDWKYNTLWQAQYYLKQLYHEPLPKAPKPWGRINKEIALPNWSFWQCGGGASYANGGNQSTWPGIEGYCDVNMYNGSLDEMIIQFP